MEAGDRRAFDEVLAHFDPACEWNLVTAAKLFRGHAELRRFLTEGLGASMTREKPDVKAEFGADEWGVFEYVSRGRFSKDALRFAQGIGEAKASFISRLGKGVTALIIRLFFIGRAFEVPVCFIYHVNEHGLIDRVHEYAATRR
jgi:hypothetical protein